ncbi:7081_t:CDS:2, partial [Ambispora leptoticha]
SSEKWDRKKARGMTGRWEEYTGEKDNRWRKKMHDLDLMQVRLEELEEKMKELDSISRAQGTYRIYQGCEEFIENDEIYGSKNFSHDLCGWK